MSKSKRADKGRPGRGQSLPVSSTASTALSTAGRVKALDAVTALVKPICVAHGLSLVQLCLTQQAGRPVLQVMIEALSAAQAEPGAPWVAGVGLDDCARVSRDLSALLDLQPELLPGSYSLQVSSPGIERPLLTAEDYHRFVGHPVCVRTRTPIQGKRTFRGTLVSFEAGVLGLRMPCAKSSATKVVSASFDEQRIALGDVSKAHLLYLG
ncbi:MAG: ribosome maturation factor RimP [Polyangiales bacterium]